MAYVADKQLGGVVVITDVTSNGVVSNGAQVASTRAFTFEQGTPGISVDIASPVPADPKMLTISNRGTVDITVQGVIIEPGPAYGLYWNGTSFVPQTIEGKGKLSATADSASTTIIGDGSPIAPLSVDVKLSEDIGNGIELRADGFYYKDPQPGKGAIIYVDAHNGSDTEGTGTFKEPYATYAKALAEALMNSTIIIYPGTYNEDIVLKSNTTTLGFGAEDGNVVKFTGKTTLGTGVGSLKLKDVILEGKPGNPTLDINGSTGGVNFDNVSIQHQSGSAVDVVTFSGNANQSWYSFHGGSIKGNVVINGNQDTFQVYLDTGAEAPTITHNAPAAVVVVSNRLQVGSIKHQKGALFLKNIGTVLKDSNGISISSTANGDATDVGYLALHDTGVIQLDGSYGTIQKTGSCPYVIGDIKSNPANDTFTGTRVYAENAVHIHANYSSPSAYTPVDPSIVGHLKGINAALAASGGGLSAVTSTDSSSIDFSGAGTVAQPLTATVKVSGAADNVIVVNSDGISVPSSATGIAEVTHDNSDTISLTGLGTVNDPLIAETFISTTAHNQLKKDGGGLVVPEIQQTVELVFQVDYAYLANQFLFAYKASKPFTLPANLTGSQSKVSASPQITDSITLAKNGTNIGSINILNNVVSFAFTSDVSFVAGDQLTAVAGGADKQFDYVSFTLFGTRPYVNA